MLALVPTFEQVLVTLAQPFVRLCKVCQLEADWDQLQDVVDCFDSCCVLIYLTLIALVYRVCTLTLCLFQSFLSQPNPTI